MKNMLLLYSPYSKASTFVIGGVNLPNVEIYPLTLKQRKIDKALFYLFHSIKLEKTAARFRYTKECIKKLGNRYNQILCFDCCRLNEYRVIKALAKSDRVNVFFWNPISFWCRKQQKAKSTIAKLKRIGIHLSTFDPIDAVEYALELKKNVNRKIVDNQNSPIKYDFYFVGKPKGRIELLNTLRSFLISHGFRVHFIVVKSSKDYISQMDNIKFSAESKCIVDIISSDQTGFTLRPFDALFLHKKLLTNNIRIVKTDFYDKNNIYVFNENNLEGICEFIIRPYKEIPKSIIDQYEINQWLVNNYL